MLIVYDDEKTYREVYRSRFSKLGIELDVLECSSKAEIREQLRNPDVINKTKVIVFDLSESKEEAESMKFDILEDIKQHYKTFSIPIFVHSAFAHKVEGYDNLGTLFKIKKDSSSIEKIVDKIKLFYDSGFLNIFSPGGILESKFHEQLHNAFIEQFQAEEVSQILDSIRHSNSDNFPARTLDVFQRIAVRALFQNLMSEKLHPETGAIDEIRINAVEHYYRRKRGFPVWTGDIFSKRSGEMVVVLTPRCDINNGNCTGRYLCCNIAPLNQETITQFTKKTENIGAHINDNVSKTGLKNRFLIPTPGFIGGRVDLTDYSIITEGQLHGEKAEYAYLISLSDELCNDVVRKFASYLMRGGISASELNEASYYVALSSGSK